MTASSGEILYRFGGISDLAANINRFITFMDSELDGLKTRGRALLGTWEGATSASFDEYVQRWDSHARDIATILLAVQNAVRNSGQNMQEADLSLASRLFTGS